MTDQTQAALCLEARDRLKARRRLTAAHVAAVRDTPGIPDADREKMLQANLTLCIAAARSNHKRLSPFDRQYLAEHAPDVAAECAVKTAADYIAGGIAKRNAVPWRECSDPDFRLELEADPSRWLKTFFAKRFNLDWAEYHREIIEGSLYAIRHGTNAMFIDPRGGGKSRPIMGTVLLANFCKLAPFPVYAPWKGESVDAAFRFWRAALENNKPLAELYPEICDPFRVAKGVAQRFSSLTWQDGPNAGRPCGAAMAVSDGLIILPDSLGAFGSTTINGNPLGMAFDAPDGSTIRPSVVFLDDPQDLDTSLSPGQVAKIVRKIDGDFGGMGGPDATLSMIMAATQKSRECVAAHYRADPEWHAKVTARVTTWPKGFDPNDPATHGRWGEWNRIRVEGVEAKDGSKADREYYAANREEMTAGMAVSWAARFDGKKGQPDAFYSAMLDFFRMGPEAFASEQQGEPLAITPDAAYTLRQEHIVNRVNGLGRGVVPESAIAVVAGVDLNRIGASWTAVAATSTPEYSVVEYDRWLPPGRKELWSRNDKNSIEKAIAIACEQIVGHLLARAYGQRLDAIVIDAGSDWARVVHDSCKMLRQVHPGVKIWSAKGASGFQYDAPKRIALIRQGHLADVRKKAYGTRQDIFLMWDSCYWHMAMQQGWLAGSGSMGAITVYGDSATRHHRLAEEVAAWKLLQVEYRGEKKQAEHKTTGPEHFGDALAMAGAALSVLGIHPTGGGNSRMMRDRIAEVAKVAEAKVAEGNLDTVSKAPEKPVMVARVVQMVRRPPAWNRW